jgi:hypothetical protein
VVAGLRGIETPTFLRRVKREEAGPRPASFEME